MENAYVKSYNTLTVEEVKEMFIYLGDTFIDNKDHLTNIDSEIGDGDHGIGMEKGFLTAVAGLKSKNFMSVNEIFKETGNSMINSMGGASGIIFGTMFIGGLKDKPDFNSLDNNVLFNFFSDALEAIKKRGKAGIGDKTMVDALEPAINQIMNSNNLYDAVKNAEIAALNGVEDTKGYVANFGRAKTLGKRSLGYQDAGATSVWLMFKGMREWLEKKDDEI